MATPLLAETIRSKRGKHKLVILGFIYTLNKSNDELYHWVCENLGHCKTRLSSKINLSIVKPKDSNGIIDSHTHGPDMSRIEMLKGYDLMRERADHISDESTRAIFASGVETMSDSSINQLPKTESVKRMIRVHKNGPDRIINSASASEIHILERYRVTPKGEPFLLFDSGVGDISRIIIFATPKMLSILRESQNW